MTTPLDVLEQAEREATVGPWVDLKAAGIPVGLIVNDEWDATSDAPFLCLLRNHAPDLIACARALEFLSDSITEHDPKCASLLGHPFSRMMECDCEYGVIQEALAPLLTENSGEL